MDRVTRYILANFSSLFLSLFLTLFFLVSVIFFITVSRLTALISVSFLDLGEIFLYAVPEIFTYTLPVTFFIAVAMTMYSMSRENEMVVLFALTLNPVKIAKIFFSLSFLTTLFLLANSIFFIPVSKQMSDNFISLKRMEAKLNIKESEFGQKFSNWHLFVHSNAKDTYNDIVLYQKGESGENDKFILAKNAKLDRNDSLLSLKLNHGKVYDIARDKLTQIDYKKLNMNYNPKLQELKSSNIIEYWMKAKTNEKRASGLSFALLVALFPLATFMFALSFGIAHMRHQKPNVYLNSMLVVILYYIAIFNVAQKFPFYGTLGVFALFFIFSALFFKKRVMERF